MVGLGTLGQEIAGTALEKNLGGGRKGGRDL